MPKIAAKTKQKRSRPSSAKPDDGNPKSAKKPKPPPPPPAALVKLLKSNKSVLKYFQSLQENLTYDVQKWKDRAKSYQTELDDIKRTRSETAARNAQQRPQQPHDGTDDSTNEDGKSHLKPSPSKPDPSVAKAPKASDAFLTEFGSPTNDSNDFRIRDSSSSDDGSEHNDNQAAKSSTTKAKVPTANAPPQKQYKRVIGSIEDHMLEFSSDDSDEDDDDDADQIPSAKRSSPQNQQHNSFNSITNEENTDTLFGFGAMDGDGDSFRNATNSSQAMQNDLNSNLAATAEAALERLGVQMWTLHEIEKNIDQTDSPTDPIADDENEENEVGPTHRWVPLPKLQVWGDMLRTLKDTIRIKDIVYSNEAGSKATIDGVNNGSPPLSTNPTDARQSNEHRYFPFMTKALLPCFRECAQWEGSDIPNHPAQQATEDVFAILSFFDLFHDFDDDESIKHAEATFQNLQVTIDKNEAAKSAKMPSLLEWMYVTMKSNSNSKHVNLAQDFITSLHGEIVKVWPAQDRANAHTAGADLQRNESEDIGAQTSTDVTASIIPVKYLVRLAALAERCILVHLLVRVYVQRGDLDQAMLLALEYIKATVPTIGTDDQQPSPNRDGDLEEPSRVPKCCQSDPALSFCVLEIMLADPSIIPDPADTDWFYKASVAYDANDDDNEDTDGKSVLSIVCLGLSAVAAINRIRLTCGNERAQIIAKIELAALERLQLRCPWLKLRDESTSIVAISKEIVSKAHSNLLSSTPFPAASVGDGDPRGFWLPYNLQLAMILTNDFEWLQETVSAQLTPPSDTMIAKNQCQILLACCNAFKELHLRRSEQYHQYSQTGQVAIKSGNSLCFSSSNGQRLPVQLFNAIKQHRLDDFALMIWTMWCCAICSDGETLIRILQFWIAQYDHEFHSRHDEASKLWTSTVSSLIDKPVVRVINLERRMDRMALFMTQSMSEEVLVIRSIASSDSSKQLNFSNAIDGQGTLVVAEMNLVKMVGSLAELNSLVHPEWRPSDLRAFDANAPSTDHLVRISPSEKACALSHLKSWQSVRDCLSILNADKGANVNDANVKLLQRFGIAGYASGPATFHANEMMDPQPVCVILEDDAIMVDRFAERLASLLEELPRDFHFCSLGYGRPKTAPIVPYSEHLGIPTSIWYLTGYVLSLQGAEYLLNSLPVRGPVDSWIGLKMFSNWDNEYGYKAGVGSTTTARSESKLPPRKELATFFHFRSFVALTPLCSQKMHGSSSAAIDSKMSSRNQNNWRKKDTDIAYSGNNKS